MDENGSLTYDEYLKKSRALAREIININNLHGYKSKVPVVVYLEKGKEVLTSFMGVAFAGCFYSPIDMHNNRVEKILGTLMPGIVITDNTLRDKINDNWINHR